MSQKPTALVFGAGSIGAVFAYLLANTNEIDVSVACRSNYDAVRQHGFTIDSAKYGNGLKLQPAAVLRSASEAKEPFSFVVVTSKAFPGSSPSTADLIAPAIGKHTAIVLVQNGVGTEQEYKDAFPHNEIISCIAYLPATQVAPGLVAMGDSDRLELGAYPASEPSDALKFLGSVLKKAGSDAVLYRDIQPQRWAKLLLNASWNPICALTLSPDVTFMGTSDGAIQFVREVMVEVQRIAQALGYTNITDEEVERKVKRAVDRIGGEGIEPSMLADRRAGRAMEVEAIVGNAMRMGKEKGVVVTRLETLYFLIKALNAAIVGA